MLLFGKPPVTYHRQTAPNQFEVNILEIPYVARIICIADAVDAMSTNRCYRDRLPEETLISELTEHAGTQFDPNMIPPMIELIHDGIIQKTQKEYPNRGA